MHRNMLLTEVGNITDETTACNQLSTAVLVFSLELVPSQDWQVVRCLWPCNSLGLLVQCLELHAVNASAN